jgi:hypothetical protein
LPHSVGKRLNHKGHKDHKEFIREERKKNGIISINRGKPERKRALPKLKMCG